MSKWRECQWALVVLCEEWTLDKFLFCSGEDLEKEAEREAEREREAEIKTKE